MYAAASDLSDLVVTVTDNHSALSVCETLAHQPGLVQRILFHCVPFDGIKQFRAETVDVARLVTLAEQDVVALEKPTWCMGYSVYRGGDDDAMRCAETMTNIVEGSKFMSGAPMLNISYINGPVTRIAGSAFSLREKKSEASSFVLAQRGGPSYCVFLTVAFVPVTTTQTLWCNRPHCRAHWPSNPPPCRARELS